MRISPASWSERFLGVTRAVHAGPSSGERGPDPLYCRSQHRRATLGCPTWSDAPRLKDVMLDVRQRRANRRYVRRYAAVGRLILACLSWGFSTALTKIVLSQLTPVDVFGIEIIISAI